MAVDTTAAVTATTGRARHPSPFDPNVFHERDYNPPRSIRGVPVSHDGPAPGARAHELESRLDRDRFTPVEHTGARMERSAGARGTAMRSVRLDNAAPLQPDTAPGLAEMRRGAAGTTPEARRQPGGGRELRNGRDNGIATLNNEAAAARAHEQSCAPRHRQARRHARHRRRGQNARRGNLP